MASLKPSIKSYASIVSPKKQFRTSKPLHPVRYSFKDIGIGTTTVNQRLPIIIMQEATPSMAIAQHLFDSKDRILDPLNTSAELDVEDVNLGNSTVHVTHSRTIQERYDELKTDEKPKNERLKQLEDRVTDLEGILATSKRQAAKGDADMRRWELLSRAIQGLNLFLWTTVLQQRQRDELQAIGIHKLEQLRIRDTELDVRAQQVYCTIPQRYKNILWTMGTHRHEIYQQRRTIAHPLVTRTEFHAYIQSSFPEFEADLRPISELQHLDAETGFTENLFIDDTNTTT